MHGWMILDKPLGLGSTQGVSARSSARCATAAMPRSRSATAARSIRSRPACCRSRSGEATKLAGRMLDSDKVYDFTIRFGEQTDTLDLEGKVIATSDVRPTLAAGGGGAAALHRGDRAGAAGLFGAEGGWRARLRSRPCGRGGGARDAGGDGACPLPPRHGEGAVEAGGGSSPPRARSAPSTILRLPPPGRGGLKRSPSPPTSPRAPTSAASRATSHWRSARSGMSPCSAAPRPGRSTSSHAISLDKLAELG